MVHSASLVHDDVIDQSDIRRGKPSVNALWNHKKVSRECQLVFICLFILQQGNIFVWIFVMPFSEGHLYNGMIFECMAN